MKKLFFPFGIAAVLCGCVNVDETPAGQKIKFVDQKPADCESLGKIAHTGYHMTKQQAGNALRNAVVSMGGDTARIEDLTKMSYKGEIHIGSSNEYYGYVAYAYKCEK